MRRPVTLVLATLALGVGSAGLSACSSAAKSPTLPRTHFTPKAEIVIGCPPGYHCPPSTPPKVGLTVLSPNSTAQVDSVPDRSTVVVKNLATGPQRVTGTIKDDQVFDTGQMARGNTTTVVLSTPGVVTITNTTSGEHVSLTVRPAPATKT